MVVVLIQVTTNLMLLSDQQIETNKQTKHFINPMLACMCVCVYVCVCMCVYVCVCVCMYVHGVHACMFECVSVFGQVVC